MLTLAALICANPAEAATFWVATPAEAPIVEAALAELWPEAHAVRVGEGEGYAIRGATLSWTDGTAERHADVDSLRAAVALARSWDQAAASPVAAGWIPATAAPVPPHSEVRVPDLDPPARPDTWWLGFGVPVGRGPVGLSVQVRRDTRVGLRVGGSATMIPWVSHASKTVPFDGGAMQIPVMQRWFEGFAEASVDLVGGPVLVEPGVDLRAAASVGAPGGWVAASPTVDLGLVHRAWVMAVHGQVAVVGTEGLSYDRPGTRLGVELRRRSRMGWDLEAGVRLMGEDAGLAPYGQLAVTTDIGRWQ